MRLYLDSHFQVNQGVAGGKEAAPVSGIFIKNVLDGSPAGLTGQLCTGDRILDVDGHDLRKASHDKAVDIIRQSGNTVTFVVQVSQIQVWSLSSFKVNRQPLTNDLNHVSSIS